MPVTIRTMMMPPFRDPLTTNNHVTSNDDNDICLSQLASHSLMISNTHEITKFDTRTLTNASNSGLYLNGLSAMTASTTGADSTLTKEPESNDAMAEASSGPLGASSASQTADVGILAEAFPDSWNGWESKRRSDSVVQYKKHKLRELKSIRRKRVDVKKVKVASIVSFRRRRHKLERSIGKHLREAQRAGGPPVLLPKAQESNHSEVVPFQSSKSLRRRQRRRVVRFREEEKAEPTVEWKREKLFRYGRGLGNAVGTETPFLEAHREQKQAQRALLDLQVGMNCMGL